MDIFLNSAWKYLEYAYLCSNISLSNGHGAYGMDKTNGCLNSWTILPTTCGDSNSKFLGVHSSMSQLKILWLDLSKKFKQ
jgi:hypothetical protein